MKLLTARLISEPRNVQTKTGGRMVADAKTTSDETQTAPAPTETKPTPTMTPSEKREIAGYIEDMAALYAFCYSQAGAKLPPEAPPEVRQACASSLFIASQRRFNLA